METARTPSEPDFRSLRSATPHPSGTLARVLLTSVFGPYAQDDEYGSRVINPMELYHNQVTRVEGPFSLRMFHRSWALINHALWAWLISAAARATRVRSRP